MSETTTKTPDAPAAIPIPKSDEPAPETAAPVPVTVERAFDEMAKQMAEPIQAQADLPPPPPGWTRATPLEAASSAPAAVPPPVPAPTGWRRLTNSINDQLKSYFLNSPVLGTAGGNEELSIYFTLPSAEATPLVEAAERRKTDFFNSIRQQLVRSPEYDALQAISAKLARKVDNVAKLQEILDADKKALGDGVVTLNDSEENELTGAIARNKDALEQERARSREVQAKKLEAERALHIKAGQLVAAALNREFPIIQAEEAKLGGVLDLPGLKEALDSLVILGRVCNFLHPTMQTFYKDQLLRELVGHVPDHPTPPDSQTSQQIPAFGQLGRFAFGPQQAAQLSTKYARPVN